MLVFTRCLQDLPKISISDVHPIVHAWSPAPTIRGSNSRYEQGFKLKISSYIHNSEEVYKDFSTAEALMICNMGISWEIPQVDSDLGKVQASSPLSYQQPATQRRNLSFHAAPPRPSVPLQNYRLQPSNCMFVCTELQA